MPQTSKQAAAAKSFVKWATSKDYVSLVGQTAGWVAAPPGTRMSTYANPDYKKAAPFSEMVLNAILSADPTHPTQDPVPYVGIQFVTIPEFQAIGTTGGQNIASALSGQQTVAQVLQATQNSTTEVMQQAGYLK